jgi:hypothetical protein
VDEDRLGHWRRRAFDAACVAISLYDARPYDLRHSFASLLLHEGRSVMYVARQLGHAAALTLNTYGHVIDELDNSPQSSPRMRSGRSQRLVCHRCVTGGSSCPSWKSPRPAKPPRLQGVR